MESDDDLRHARKLNANIQDERNWVYASIIDKDTHLEGYVLMVDGFPYCQFVDLKSGKDAVEILSRLSPALHGRKLELTYVHNGEFIDVNAIN